jgi:hypothetical protein
MDPRKAQRHPKSEDTGGQTMDKPKRGTSPIDLAAELK